MNDFLAFFSTPEAVALAWIFTFLSLCFGIFQRNDKAKISIKCKHLESTVQNLSQQLSVIQSDNSVKRVKQDGSTNINVDTLNGPFNLNQ